MKQTFFSHKSNDQLLEDAEKFSKAQRDMAASTTEDSTYWHHIAVADLIHELGQRLKQSKRWGNNWN